MARSGDDVESEESAAYGEIEIPGRACVRVDESGCRAGLGWGDPVHGE